jgi:vacuolar-type H+-ATPase subunit E/Vma4
MPETIESFVTRLQNEGIQAGAAAAEKIRSDAEREARQLIEAAENQARKIVEDAKTEGQKTRARTETELHLAARDAVGRLQETLSRVLRDMLLASVREPLNDPDFLKGILHEIVQRFIIADIEQKGSLIVNLSAENQGRLARWAIEEMCKKTPGRQVVLKGALSSAGFEYTTGDGTIEVTPDSVVEVLTSLIGPELRRMITQATENGNR